MDSRRLRNPVAEGERKAEVIVLHPLGHPISGHDLPSPSTRRWTVRRKAEVVAGVRARLISMDEACERNRLTPEEFQSWQELVKEHGLAGLRTTKTQNYRRRSDASPVSES